MRDYLFGFTTTRNPATISREERDRFHILMIESDRQQTRYWSDHERETFVGLLQTIRRRGVGVTGIPSLQALKADFANLLAFYRAVVSDKRRTDLSDLHQVANDLGASALPSGDRVLLWDSFAHYLWVDEQRTAVDTVRAIMIADKILNKLEELEPDDLSEKDNQANLRRIAKAQVVLPLPVEAPGRFAAQKGLSGRQQDLLEQAHDRIVNGAAKRRLSWVRREFAFAVAKLRATPAEPVSPNDPAPNPGRTPPSGPDVITSRPPMTSRTVDASGQPIAVTLRPEEELTAVLDTITAPAATAVLLPLREKSLSIQTMQTALDAEFVQSEDDAEGEIETTYQVAFWAFGTEFMVEERIPAGAMIVKAHRSRIAGLDRTDMFLTYFHDRKVPKLAEVQGTLTIDGTTRTISGEPLDTDEDGFQTFQLNETPLESSVVDVDLALRSALPDGELVRLDRFRVFAQSPQFAIPDLTEETVEGLQPPPPLHGIESLGVIEYRRVEQELACYVTGAVSRIESIPARAFKERSTRTLSATETEQEVTQELASERQTDSETTEKHEMQSEVESVISSELSKTFDFGTGVSVKLPGVGDLTTETSTNFNIQSAAEESTSQAITMAKQVTQKVQDKIMKKSTARRKSSVKHEFEDYVKQGYDNRLGENHVVCVHRWVDKIMSNYLVNYGRMSVVEFVIPEPAKNFIRAQEATRQEEDFEARRPKSPKAMGLRSPKSIKSGNYRRFAKAYGVELDPPPRETIVISRAFSDSMSMVGAGEDSLASPNRSVSWNDIAVPDGYAATSALVRAKAEDALRVDGEVFSGGGYIQISVANGEFQKAHITTPVDLDKIEGSVPVGVMSVGAGAFVINVTVTCSRKYDTLHRWQMQSYSRLMEAYRALKDAYDQKRAEHEAEADRALDLNPRFKQQVMERELKRICIEMIADQHNIEITGDHYNPAPDGELYPLRFSVALDRHAKLVRFLEQALNWPLMSYIFYPYFYASRDSWAVKISHEATRDRLFAAFLSSGMGRVMLPIRPGFEASFSYFLQTGQVWFGSGFVLDSEDDLYLSIADEMITGTQERVIEERWQTKLPTNLTILQDSAAAMIGEGLPCEISENRIGTGSSTLAPVLPEAAANTGD
ncbi:hypothetical protein [Roseibium sp. RKSG952]|uniref:hypothetical protein n=1 Tax=Roseibium sp. RKSG952 TaxID=2529384 RepID=UPI0012BD42B8|nr:hypothetical protein [Roseibium sp. RKSG952]MTH95320.1 hypothetical protein [Roseibium sp. RKSG952]